MTQEQQKDLLYKNLCARLPYYVRVNYKGDIYDVLGITHGRLVLCKPFQSQVLAYCPLVEEVKPYLFPISIMSDEQKKEYNSWKHLVPVCHYEYGDVVEEYELWDSPESFEYLIENHFDYNRLIEEGLAIDATNKNIY